MAQKTNTAWGGIGRAAMIPCVALLLSACEEGKSFSPFKSNKTSAESADAGTTTSKRPNRKTGQYVEAPDVFQKTDNGLWDGRPSLGGVWVAHTDVTKPERVIIRNTATGKSVTGALFRRERENPGPKIQVSSDAAKALGMLAGQPAKLGVIAMRREEVEEEPAPVISEEVPTSPDAKPQARPAAKEPTQTRRKAPASGSGSKIEETTLDPIASAAAAIEAADGATAPAAAEPVEKPVRTPKPLFALSKPFVELATFTEEKGATEAATTLREAGLEPVIKEQQTGEAAIWRVLVGPAANRKQRTALAKQVKGLGFTNARFVKE